jgi:4-amino-4-deoxy-L-arabinose transferase-like glycosyltransferase
VAAIGQRISGRSVLVVAAAAALPRLAVLAIERETILEDYVEKSDRFATTLVESGTFGFLPDVPSAYTQPLYAWVLAALYWTLERHWLVVGLAHVAIAVATALLVLAIGRHVASTRIGIIAALITTLHPYVVWHDMHVNREPLDGLLLAGIAYLALLAHERGSALHVAAAGGLTGLAILGNSRLVLLPLALAPYLVWRARPPLRAIALGVLAVAVAAAVVTPWLVRNKVEIGCVTLTTDARALWKANNPATYETLAAGLWIDDVPDPPGIPPWPERAADDYLAGGPLVAVDECAQMRFYQDEVKQFWREQPSEKAKLAGQAVRMLWSPFLSVEADDEGQQGLADVAQRTVEPMFMLVLYALALWGAFLAPRHLMALVAVMLSYSTLAAMVFAGTVRYRVPWDFLLALLAAFAVERAGSLLAERRQTRARESAER